MTRHLASICLLLVLSGCVNIPDTYAPPVQRKPLATSDPYPFGSFTEMGNPKAAAYIVKDVAEPEGGQWRWTRKRPELQFYLEGIEGLHYVMDFSVAGATFQDTGPVTISIAINGLPFDSLRFDKPGEHHYRKAVPAALMKAKSPNRVLMEIDKEWVSKTDGAVLGFILMGAGFQP
ncbi:MAG: hypothetical protein ABIZ80_04955 [Bryobacteraceae bacterium]